VGVVIERVVTGERLEVAVHVEQHEGDEQDAGDGHQELERDGRG